jgi:DNA-binding MarR family transcriptional regulator
MTPEDPKGVLGPDLDFLRELWALDNALQKLSRRMQRTLGVSGPERLALRLIDRHPGLPPGRLARLMHLHPSTVSGLVKRLADRGWIVRSVDSPDRRCSQLRITPAGLDLLGRPSPTIDSAVVRALQGLSSQRVGIALRVLATLAMGLEVSDAGAFWP